MIDKMKRIIVFLTIAALLSLAVPADIPRLVNIRKSFTSAGVSDTINLETSEFNSGVRYHMLSWVTSGGTMSACFVALEQSVDALTWTDLIAKVPCATAASTIVAAGQAPYLRINVSTFTANAGTPMLRVVYAGYQDNPFPGDTPPTSSSTSTSSTSSTSSSTSSTSSTSTSTSSTSSTSTSSTEEPTTTSSTSTSTSTSSTLEDTTTTTSSTVESTTTTTL